MNLFKIPHNVTILALIWIVGTSLGLMWLMPDPVAWFGIIAFLGGFGLVLVARRQSYFAAQHADLKQEFVPVLPPVQKEFSAPEPALAPISETLIAEKMQQLFDRLPIALVQIDSRGRVGQSNAAAREFLRLEPAESPLFDSLVEGMGRSVSAWIQSSRDVQEPTSPEMVQVRRSLGEEILQVTLMPPPVAGQGGLIATLSDATELKSLEAQFVQSQKMQAIGQLAGGVAHDFNNLLTAISGYCDLMLLRHEKGDPDYNDLIQITQNANRAAALVGQLLAFSRKQTLQPKVISVNETLSDLTHLLSRLLGEKVQLNAEYGKDLPRAFVDGRQIEQVILNLVVNARDAMPDGGEVSIKSGMRVYDRPTRVDRALVPKGTYVTVSVADTGSGIHPEHMEKLFEPFFTTKDVGDGTGLGLSMAYGIVKQTSGFIFAKSTVGEGSEFTLLLPAHDGREKSEVTTKSSHRTPAKSLNGLSVMLVEDEAPVRTFVARALAMQGVRVTEASSAEIALEKLQDADLHVDLIVSDVVMPGMDGPTWVVKAQESRPDVSVIFVSGYAEENFTSEYGEIPNAHFLPKPFSLKQLTETVRDLAA
ncbi:hybrid sensor histidine kinase/response regulator [Neptunicoccus sediminis]|uniref:hybrid sensor histidine kinase/response regulator n=1 Tax=Neptunicoccus sediminis TaxID=1892596 RepID=UPI000845F1FE|nr:PAS domain-containing sensor histidine kinase [Neptunicoccus sediminis]